MKARSISAPAPLRRRACYVRASPAAWWTPRSGLPHGQVSAIAARKAALGYLTACLCLSQAKKICSPKRRRLSRDSLTVIRGSDSLSVAKKMRGLPGRQRFGGLFFCLQLPSWLWGTRFTHHSASMAKPTCGSRNFDCTRESCPLLGLPKRVVDLGQPVQEKVAE